MSKITNFLIFLLLLLTNSNSLQQTTQISQCGNGRATYYTTNEYGSCGFGDITGKIATAAADMEIYDVSNACGICYEVIGEKGSTIVMIADLCPGCETLKNTGVIHLDLDERIFPEVDEISKGRIDTSIRMVACPVSGNVKLHITETNDSYFNAFASNYKIGLKSLEVNINNEGFKEVKRASHNRFIQGSISNLNSIKVKLISISGQEILCYSGSNIVEGVYECEAQFSAYKFFDIYTREITSENMKSECCVKPSLISDLTKCNIKY